MKKIVFLGISLFLFMEQLTAQIAVLNVKDKEIMKEDPVISYFLPKTVLVIEVEAVKTVKKVGPYASESRKYFGEPADIRQDEEFWEIKKIHIKQKSEPDVENQYKVYAQHGSNASLLSLTNEGVLKGINLPLVSSYSEKDQIIKSKKGKKNSKEKDISFVSDFVIKSDDSAKVKERPQIAFEQINKLRETKLDLLLQNSDILQNGDAVEAYLKAIKKEEKELVALFNGKEYKEKIRKTYIVYPNKEMTNQDVFRFSSKKGFDDSGDIITISLKRKYIVNKSVSVPNGKNGFIYRVPALVDIEIKNGRSTLWTGEMSISQLGTLVSLPSGFFEKNDVRALFDSQSGALLQLSK